MADNFIQIIERTQGQDYPGDEYGGGRGKDGSGLPEAEPRSFMFATGIECSYPTIKGGLRRDQMKECSHYDRWQEDLVLVRELGLRVLRYGLPYYKVHTAPGKFDWSFADEVMNEIKRLEIIPILDLMHFGVPDWIGNLQNPELPIHLYDYAKAVAERYPWVRFYTPVNEMYVTARVSARDGLWNECLKDDKAFVTAMKHTVAAATMATHAVVQARPDAVFVQSESAEYIHDMCATPRPEYVLANKLRLLALDLLYAHPVDSDVMLFLQDNGLTRAEYDWFMRGSPPGYQVLGTDYYGRNERIIKPDGNSCTGEDVIGWFHLTHEYYQRYHKPLMHTETNTFDPDLAPNWLWKQWANIMQMRQVGVPVLGFTWYSLTDQIDWDTELAEKNDRVIECGLYDLDRKPHPVAEHYRMLLEEYGQISVVPHGEMFQVTDQPATLKADL